MDPIEDTIKTFVANELMFDKDASLIDADSPLLERGIIDSLGIQQLVTFLQERFKVAIPDEEVLPENFETIKSIANLVKQLTPAGVSH